jgi:hypothetical protein
MPQDRTCYLRTCALVAGGQITQAMCYILCSRSAWSKTLPRRQWIAHPGGVSVSEGETKKSMGHFLLPRNWFKFWTIVSNGRLPL